jgi:hypothetical protein
MIHPNRSATKGDEPMPTLSLSISGLCVFAFDQLLKGTGPPPTQATLLLQPLIRSQELDHQTNGVHDVLDQHFPMLEFNPDDRDAAASTRGPDFLCTPDAQGKMKTGVCTLFSDDLTILIDGRTMGSNGNVLKLTRTPPANPSASTLTGTDRETLWWMATLEDAFPGKGRVNPIFINNPLGPNQTFLARVVLSEGTLKTVDLSDHPCIFTSVSSANVNTSFNQRIATSFVLEVPFAKTIEIRMKRPNSNNQFDTSQMIFSPAAGQDLQIAIKNMEIDPSIGLPPYKNTNPRSEADFEVYAKLLPGVPVQNPPSLSAVGPSDVVAGVSMGYCPPTGG